jgi:hypothetical protein
MPSDYSKAEAACTAAGAAVAYAAIGKADAAIATAALSICWLPDVATKCCWDPSEILLGTQFAYLEQFDKLRALIAGRPRPG